MIGAIIGDVVGSRFEWNNHRSRDFELFHPDCRCTDDSILTVAVMKALLESKADFSDLSEKAVYRVREIGNLYPDGWYSRRFKAWLISDDPAPYGAKTNGAAMRVSACAYAAKDFEEAKRLSRTVTEITHNSPEAVKGAEAVTVPDKAVIESYAFEKITEIIRVPKKNIMHKYIMRLWAPFGHAHQLFYRRNIRSRG
ncbi:MAG: ADP-ribosylglycohydrolase family protein [Clostridia bacterium]|nr:ADP-ribosylglycohydrolase family protein [Clostridia bacterium]